MTATMEEEPATGTTTSKQQQVPETSLSLKDLLEEGSCMSFKCATESEPSILWTCSPSGEIKVIDPRTGVLAINPNTQEAVALSEVNGTPTCLAVGHQEQVMLIGTDSGKVELDDLRREDGVPDYSFDCFLVRCTSSVRDVAFSPTDKWAAVASGDLELRLVEVKATDVTSLRKHDGSVRSVCFDPQEEYLVSLGMDGYAMVWDLATKQCVFSKKVMERESKDETHGVVPKAAWKPDGSLLALPGNRQPILVERGTWNLVASSSVSSAPASPMAHTGEISVMAWAAQGDLLATAGADKRVVIWAAPKGFPTALRPTQIYMDQEDAVHSTALAVRSLAWVTDRKLAILNVFGAFAVQSVPAAAAIVSAVGLASKETAKEGAAATTKASAEASKSTQEIGKVAESDSENEAAAASKKKKKNPFLDDEASSVDRDRDEEQASEDEGEGAEEEEPPPPEDDDDEDGAEDSIAGGNNALVQVPHMQGPFLPSSSPLDAPRRYLVWSTVGNIVSQNIGDHNVIEIEFADASRRPIRFTDHYRFVMGSIAEDGAIFASAAFSAADDKMVEDEEEDEHSTVFFRPFANYSTKNQWLYTLPKGEGALSVAVGTRWAAVATTRQWVRLFTFSGLQEGVVAVPGPIVTMVGKGDLLAIFYHGGSPLVDASTGNVTQSLHYQLLDVRRSTVVATGPLALSSKSLLSWAGFSNLEILHIMDSEGLLYGLVKGFGWHWTPLLETKKLQRNKMDSFWPVGVYNGNLMCTLLKGGDEHPSTNPKPLVSSLPLKMPLVACNNEQALLKLEDTRLLSKVFLHQKLHQQEVLAAEGLEEPQLETDLLRDQAAYDKHLVKMIQMAAANENAERMVEVAEMLNLQKSLELAIRVADHYSMPQVAARISELLNARFPPTEDFYDYGAQDMENRAPVRGGYGGESNMSAQAPRESMGEAEEDMALGGGGGDEEEDGEQGGGGARRQLSRAHSNPGKGRGGGGKAGKGSGSGSPSSSAASSSRNPFAVKKDQAASKPAEKRPRGIVESLGSMMGSPSPKLSKTSSFVSEIRSKKKHDRRA